MKKRYFFKSIFIKFAIAFIFVGLIPLMTISYFVLGTLPQDMENVIISNYTQMLIYSSKNIEMKLSEYNQISQLIYYYQSKEYGSIIEILENKQNGKLEDFLRTTVYSEKNIKSAFLINNDLEIYSVFSQNATPLVDDFNFELYLKPELIETNKRKLTIIPTHNEDYFSRSENIVVSFIRNYLDIEKLPLQEKVVSLFCIEVNTDFIKQIIDPLSRDKEDVIFVIDRRGYPIFQSSTDNKQAEFKKIYKQIELLDPEDESGYISDSEGYIFYKSIKDSDWIIIYKVKHSSIFQLINEFKSIVFIIILVLIITLLVLALAFSRKLSQPIKNIISQMKLVEAGDLTSLVTVKTHDEIYQLAQAFNRMVKSLKEHINRAYITQIKQKEMELNAIRTQIRPHYLYNTLEIIRMSALEEEAGNTQTMIYALSEQLKYVIGYTKVKVPLKRELELVKNYFNIIYIRYEKRFRLELEVPEILEQFSVLKLMIQPIVENAIVHGLKPKKGKGTVKISIIRISEILKIQIIDDGIGIYPEKLKEIQSTLQQGEDLPTNCPEEHIGLINVQSRIQLIYGKEFGIEISSKLGMGTLAEIIIPVENIIVTDEEGII